MQPFLIAFVLIGFTQGHFPQASPLRTVISQLDFVRCCPYKVCHVFPDYHLRLPLYHLEVMEATRNHTVDVLKGTRFYSPEGFPPFKLVTSISSAWVMPTSAYEYIHSFIHTSVSSRDEQNQNYKTFPHLTVQEDLQFSTTACYETFNTLPKLRYFHKSQRALFAPCSLCYTTQPHHHHCKPLISRNST